MSLLTVAVKDQGHPMDKTDLIPVAVTKVKAIAEKATGVAGTMTVDVLAVPVTTLTEMRATGITGVSGGRITPATRVVTITVTEITAITAIPGETGGIKQKMKFLHGLAMKMQSAGAGWMKEKGRTGVKGPKAIPGPTNGSGKTSMTV
jgi:hypothetical protein